MVNDRSRRFPPPNKALELSADPLGGHRKKGRRAAQTGAFAYFALAFGWSWLFWLAHVRWGGGADPSRSPLFLIGGAGPLLAAIALTHLRENTSVRRSFWVRAFDPRRIRGAWWVAALLLHPAIVSLAFAIDVGLGGSAPAMPAQMASVGSVLSLAFFVFWFGPLPEEMGWRGFALDRLQVRMSARAASVLLGTLWALWHVPLFFVPSTFQAALGLGSERSLIFLCSMVPLSVLMGWVYNNTSRSTLSAALVHFSGNVSGALFRKSNRVAALELVLLCLACVLIAVRWSGRRPTGACS